MHVSGKIELMILSFFFFLKKEVACDRTLRRWFKMLQRSSSMWYLWCQGFGSIGRWRHLCKEPKTNLHPHQGRTKPHHHHLARERNCMLVLRLHLRHPTQANLSRHLCQATRHFLAFMRFVICTFLWYKKRVTPMFANPSRNYRVSLPACYCFN